MARVLILNTATREQQMGLFKVIGEIRKNVSCGVILADLSEKEIFKLKLERRK